MGDWFNTPFARAVLDDLERKAQERLGMRAWRARQAEWDARGKRLREGTRRYEAEQEAAVRRCTCGGGSAPE